MTSAILLENIHANALCRFKEAGIEVERHSGALSGNLLRDALATHQIVGIRSSTQIMRPDIEAAGHLHAIGCFCIGTSQVDLSAAAQIGIPVFNAPFSNTRSVAELIVAEAILLLRRVPEKNTLAHAGTWAKGAEGSFEARGKTIAIIGYGNVGAQVGVLAEALGMRVVYYDVQAKLSLGSAKAARSVAAAISQADVVTLHVPATLRTAQMIDATALSLFKPGAVLLNASRGSVIDINALAHALQNKVLGGAAIDVFPDEPGTNDERFSSVLSNMPNVLLTPHIGGSTQEAQENIGTEVAAKLIAFLATGDTAGAVNFPHVSPGPLIAPARLLNVHGNAPGVLAALNGLLAKEGANIVAQQLQTKGETGYVVSDLDRMPSKNFIDIISDQPGFIRTRVLTKD
ncbi:D-3-phosphoglycerate dehydrogenase [Paraburkholderia sp. GAS333]|uniref:phosphoglycerate dehydrogenase n=1 Tax=Paraburkholderia sp. GAS333 TaxID=3156279 RepID=UPI003D21715D